MKTVLMTLYGQLETDARVLRSIEAALAAKFHVIIITCNTRKDFLHTGNVEIKNLPFKTLGGISYIRFCWECIKYFLQNKNRIDVVYLHDFFSTLLGIILNPFCKGKKMVYDAHELILTRPNEHANLRDKLFLWSESRIAEQVDLVIEANKERDDIFKKKYPKAKTTHVLNITKFKNTEKRLLDKNNIVIVYQGTLTEERHLSFYIDAISQMDNTKLLMIGSGISFDFYKDKVKDIGLEDRVQFTGRLSNAEMMERMRSCSIGIISYPFTNLNNIYCSPNKIFEYAAISLPFIATAQPFIKKVQEKYHIGRTFEFNNIASFVENVNKILSDYSSYNCNTDIFLQDYSYEKELSKMVGIFNALRQ